MLPQKIHKLDESVINRIAAGEVIQRPANALKEMIENSLDAGSTNISVTVKQGGLKLLHIQDNGSGISKESLDIVCERFTTSKLTKFEDLLGINTYGFRGEALSSISHVAHLTIVTKTSDSPVGYKVLYEDGKPKGPPKPCAALQGTQIRVEDLFYNIATRRKALNNYSEEYSKIYEVVSRYAILNHNVSFSLKKEGENTSDVKTPMKSTALDNIRLIYGPAIAKELLEIKDSDPVLKLDIQGYITNVNYSTKKLLFLLFINQRLVDSSALRKVVEQIYSTYLPKGNHPFVYLSINLNPKNVDVNVHPTKHEIHFLHEEAIFEKIRKIIETKLSGSNSSRQLYTQAKLPTNFTVTVEHQGQQETVEKRTYAHELKRVDGSEQKIDKFFKEVSVCDDNTITSNNGKKRVINLKSILQLKSTVEANTHRGLLDLVKNFSFIGVVQPSQCLLQYNTNLYLCSTEKIVSELFYQIILYEFANLGVFKFTHPINIAHLLQLVVEDNDFKWNEDDGSKYDIVEKAVGLLEEKSALLEDYFSIDISEGHINSLPILLDNHNPNLGLLPDFLWCLCTKVDWEEEQTCLDNISRELANFYAKQVVEREDLENLKDSQWKRQIEHILLPAAKSTLLPPTSFTQDGTILEIAKLSNLYRVFERC